ncbi:MAG TPA: efflux RND transporter periplasmic adaptor subunit [Mycobacteriales bacterium]|nr:efflux RND transporter periplasmic adaptor subunit [Mycobacteriales bacterium]
MKRLVPVVALAAAAVLVGGVALARSGDDLPQVQLAEVVRADVAEVVEAPGNVTARASATLTSPADAVVEAVLVQDGESVTAGQVLVRLASPSAQERLRAAETAAANAAAARVDVPRADLSPLQDALDAAATASFNAGYAAAAQLPDPEQRAAAERQVAEAEQRYAQSSAAAREAMRSADAGAGSLESALNAVGGAQRAQAQAAVTAARGVVDALTVTAPIDGVVTLGAVEGGGGGGDLSGLVGSLPAEVQGQAEALLGGGGSAGAPTTTSSALTAGQTVSSGSSLLTVTDLSGLGVTAEVDETDVLLVQPGVQADVEIDAVPGAVYGATVASVDVAPTASTRGGVGYRVRLVLAEGRTDDGEPAPSPKPGMSAIVDLQVRSSGSGALAVPTSAVVRDGADDAVLVVEDGVVERRVVRLGAQGEDRVEVVSGVEAGERVVARDADRLTDGQRVQA